MPKEKKLWAKPQLVVLVRSKPEEVVLVSCKGAYPNQTSAGGPGSEFFSCSYKCNFGCETGGAS